MIHRHIVRFASTAALSALVFACGGQPVESEGTENDVPVQAEEEPESMKILGSFEISPTATLEVSIDETGDLLVSVSGDSALDSVLLAETSDALRTKELNAVIAQLTNESVPEALRQAMEALAAKRSAEPLEPAEVVAAENPGPLDEGGGFELPGVELSTFRGGGIRFDSLFCDGAEGGVIDGSGERGRQCDTYLDRIPNPYIQQSRFGYRHVVGAAAEDHTLKLRAYSRCTNLFCNWKLRSTYSVSAGRWQVASWYSSGHYYERRVRVDAWDSDDRTTARAHVGISWDNNSSTSGSAGTLFCTEVESNGCIGAAGYYNLSTTKSACSDYSYAEAMEDAIDAMNVPQCGTTFADCCQYRIKRYFTQ